MFFALSKILWFFVEPLNVIGFALALCVAGLFFARLARAAKILLGFTTVFYLLAAFGPLGPLLTRPLEDRFPRPGPDMAAPDDIVVLGGAMDEFVSDARHALVLDVFGSRMTEAVALARRFPAARVIFTGGSATFSGHEVTEAEVARRYFIAMGIAPERCVFEDKSRNTYENAIFTRDLVKPAPGEKFLLVTSGFHMPRSMGIFRLAGFNIVAWPADYMTLGVPGDYWQFRLHAEDGFRMTTVSLREWIGLVAYRLTGKTDALFPGP